MDVLKEIYDWSDTRPIWQRDALRRLITQSSIDDSDISDLTELCKSAHGLSEPIAAAPLEEKHIRSQSSQTGAVILTSVVHHGGVNALASEQKLEFGSALTIVYGANAAGKSGFTRILKSACRARGSEEILGNILANSPPLRPQATISAKVSGTTEDIAWDGNSSNEALSRVSVFDSQSAAVYLTEKTDVAFRPLGLDIFDRLSELCGQVRIRLEIEKRGLINLLIKLPRVQVGTDVDRLLSNITSLTDPNAVKRLATLSEEENKRLSELKRILNELESQDPIKTADILILRWRRLVFLKAHMESVKASLSDVAITKLFDERDRLHLAHTAAEAASQIRFLDRLLKGAAFDLWRRLWEAARQFSVGAAYPRKEFPVIEDSQCVLCQQQISAAARERLQEFEKTVQSTAQQDYDRLKQQFDQATTRWGELRIFNADMSTGLDELAAEDDGLSNSLKTEVYVARVRQERVLGIILSDVKERPINLPEPSFDTASLDPIIAGLQARAGQLLSNNQDEIKKNLTRELRGLEARSMLGEYVDAVFNEIERKKKLAAYEVCLRDTDTTHITRKSTEVTNRTVTEQLAASFQSELQRLKFTHVEVALQPAGGVRGTLYHKLVLKRSPASNLPSVLSEGEARCLSIASFFAELSTAHDQSAVLFDDPVSSLDHIWRERVASRLAEEARSRQVIVFTHDIVFLLALMRFAEDLKVNCQHQQLRREGLGAGVASPDLPWAAMKLRQRLGALRSRWQRAEALLRNASREDYDREALYIYGILREAWERGMEEVLLGGIVERYRPNVQTQQVKMLSDITNADCEALEAGMTKCSRWLPGHDLSPAENAPVPEPDELKADIDALENWMQTISRRRR